MMGRHSTHSQRDEYTTDWENVRLEVAAFINLPENWDDDGALPVNHQLIATTIKWFRILQEDQFPVPSAYYPLANGSIMVEWHLNQSRIAATIRKIDRIEIVHNLNGEQPSFVVVNLTPPIHQVISNSPESGSYSDDYENWSLAA